MSIIVLGTVALDTVKTPVGMRRDMLGGSAAHFAMAARFFTPVSLVSVVGEDFPHRHVVFLKKKGIDVASLTKKPGKTFHWQGEYRGDLNSALTLNTELGVLKNFHPQVTEEQKNIEYIFLANVDPDLQSGLLSKIHRPKLVGLDSMNFWIKHKRHSLLQLMKKVDIFVANDAEARDLTAETNLVKAAKRLRFLGPSMVLIKKGEHGSLFYGDDFLFSIPAFPVEKIIDPTGAGDSFAGGFMGFLAWAKKLNERILKAAVAYGTIIASFNVEGFGLDKVANLSRREIETRLKQFRRMVSW